MDQTLQYYDGINVGFVNSKHDPVDLIFPGDLSCNNSDRLLNIW